MALLRFQVAASIDSTLPRDQIVNTLHFSVANPAADADALCADLINIFQAGWYINTCQIVCDAYEVGPAPNYPVGHAEENMGATTPSNCPREVAICLSYYAQRNLPRQRGRIYLGLCGSSYTAGEVRPPLPRMQQVLDLAQDFGNLGGVDVDWQVYSPTSGQSMDVTNAWVDDEWDTVRSRGLRATRRIMATLDE